MTDLREALQTIADAEAMFPWARDLARAALAQSRPVTAQPIAWRYRYKNPSGSHTPWNYTAQRPRDYPNREIQALYTPPLAAAGREEIARIIAEELGEDFAALADFHFQHDTFSQDDFLRAADAVLALGPAVSPQTRGVDRAAVIEECAQVADAVEADWTTVAQERFMRSGEAAAKEARDAASDIAEAIRALALPRAERGVE